MYIGRRTDGSVYGTWTVRQPADEHHPGIEEVPDDHPDVVAFRNRPVAPRIDEIAALKVRVEQLEAKTRT